MKSFTFALLSLLPFVLAQDSTPTTAVVSIPDGCEPHGDHWHCESGVAKPTFPPPTDLPQTEDHDHDHDHDHTTFTDAITNSSKDPGPSPTQSYGCEPHGDHWHCEGPITATNAPAESPTAAQSVPPNAAGAVTVNGLVGLAALVGAIAL